MDSDRLAERLEELRRALLAAETYLIQIRIAVTELQAEVASRPADRDAPAAVPPSGH